MNSADLVVELRDIYENWGLSGKGPGYLREAADRIEALEAWKAEAMEVLRFYADPEHWRTHNADGTLTNTGYGLAHHKTGEGSMEILSSNCGQWVPSKIMVHGGHWQADAGHTARRLVEKGDGR